MLIRGNARHIPLADESVQCCVCSPPYWGLRDYGVPGQLGLEKTPEEYVANMVAVFREVRRVLRPDGTLFLNLGDSYAGGGRGGNPDESPFRKQATNTGSVTGRAKDPGIVPLGLKPKDLVGIPWRVAFALQQPYYAGRIKRVEDRVWLAAMIDAEGCIFIHKRKEGQSNGQGYSRKNDSYGSGLEVANCSEAVVRRCMEIAGAGSICSQGSEQNSRRKQVLHRWNLRSNECRDILREVYPHLVAKQQQARLSIGCPSSGEKADAAHRALMGLHNGIATDVDFPPPASMYEPGWWLRQDCIWSKLNPMPESVTDRCTKSHEYIFLLTKSARYFYDAEAVKEPGTRYEWNTQKFKGGDLTRHHGSTCGKEEGDPNAGRNLRSVWHIATQPYKEAHFATFPEKLVEPCILAGTSERGCCAECGAPWERVVERGLTAHDGATDSAYSQGTTANRLALLRQAARERGEEYSSAHKTLGWKPTCSCGAATKPCIVLDPFCGSGTVGVVCARFNREFIGLELNEKYIELAKKRQVGVQPFLAEATC